MLKKLVISLFLLVSVGTFGQQKANYELAERFRRITQMPLTKNSLEVNPCFINNTDRFWYSFRTSEGKNYYLVDPAKKEKRLLFDNAELLMKISEITKKGYNHKDLELNLDFDGDGETIRFWFDRKDFTYNIKTKELKLEEKQSFGKQKNNLRQILIGCIIVRIVLICCLLSGIISISWEMRVKVRTRLECN